MRLQQQQATDAAGVLPTLAAVCVLFYFLCDSSEHKRDELVVTFLDDDFENKVTVTSIIL